MSENYRIRLKIKDYEVEVESSNKEYVETKINELINSELPKYIQKVQTYKSGQGVQPRTDRDKQKPTAKSKDIEEKEIDIPSFITSIKNHDKYPIIEEKILNKKDQLPRIMMCLYFAKDSFGTPYLTTGQIETILDQFGTKIKSTNISNKIRNNLKFFDADKVRKKGAIMKYKLNRHGIIEFEKYLTPE